MQRKDLKYYYSKAQKEGWAMAQFNFSSDEQLKGIVQAAVKLRSPLLLGTSEGDSGFLGLEQTSALVDAYREKVGIPIFLNLDHGHSIEIVEQAIEAGYDAVHFDGSRLPFEENVQITKRIVELAHNRSVSVVEGEFQEVPGKHSTLHEEETLKLKADEFTDPEQAARFVKETGVDALAVLIGTVHGVYKQNPRLDLIRLQKIRKQVQSFLVLHGGSGTPPKDLLAAIKQGVVKVNVSTELRAAFTEQLRKTLAANPKEITPYNIFPPVVEQVQKVAEKKIMFFGSSQKI
ncbi:MAG: class II fructose-bisphosphate aldolase [Patescibacteria group bacterium]